ncbi:MAG: ATP-grasp domain-containing protein [Candidatus Gracilibacteria bacterium]|nr:ATP-grasp domain-containing protein [Candidatus Gracilibacteria bacterium]
MHTKAIVHIMTKSRMKSEVFTSDIDAIEEVSEKYGIKNVIFYKGEKIEYADLINKLKKLGIFLYNYSNKEDLKEKAIEFSKDYEIIFVNTAIELLINTVNEVRSALGHSVSDNPNIFRNKFLQRDLLQKHNPDLGVKFVKGTVDDFKLEELEQYVGYPFIIKPIDGVQSSGVAKIKNKKDFLDYVGHYKEFHDRLEARGINNKELIVEEYIDGTLYSIDYYIDNDGKTFLSKPVKVRLGVDVNVNDYCNIARISSEKTEGEFKGKRLKTFVNSNVTATGIKNTFVHHEFKINSKGELKTIELNGRLGGGRLELMNRAYGINMYELICNPEIKISKLKENNIVVNIYATKRGMLREFNHKLLEKIRTKKSVYGIDLEECYVGKEIGLTKDGFIKIGNIKLANKNYEELASDFKYIKKHYGDLLIIDEFDENKKIKKKNIFKIFREYLNR